MDRIPFTVLVPRPINRVGLGTRTYIAIKSAEEKTAYQLILLPMECIRGYQLGYSVMAMETRNPPAVGYIIRLYISSLIIPSSD